MSIRLKLTALAVLLTLITASIVGVASYRIMERELVNAAFERLGALRETRLRALRNELIAIENTLLVAAGGPGVASLVNEVSEQRFAYEYGDEQLADVLVALYQERAGNAEPILPPNVLSAVEPVRAAIEAADRWLRPAMPNLGFDDLYLVLPDGFVAYSVLRNSDFAGFVLNDRDVRGTGLMWAFVNAVEQRGTVLTQPELYPPANNAARFFVATPLIHDEELSGVLVARLSTDELDRVLQVIEGMGDTGETYLVGADRLMRSSSRFSAEQSVLRQKVDTPMVRAALAGETGRSVQPDYRDQRVLSVYGPFVHRGVRLALMAEIDEAEILAPLHRLAREVLVLVVAVAAVLGGAGLLLASRMMRPLVQLSSALQSFGQTRRLTDVPHTNKRDEIGDIARVVAEAGSEIELFLERQEMVQKELQRSEARFKAVVDQLPSAILLKDSDGGYLFVNERGLNWFGADEMFELLGARSDEMFDAAAAAEFTRLGDTALAGQRVREHEMTAQWPDGRRRVMLVSMFPIRTEDGGELLALGTVVTDISAIRAAEEDVRRAEAELRAILSNVPVGVFRADADERIVFFNDTWQQLLDFPDRLSRVGISVDDLLEHRIERGDPVSDRAEHLAWVEDDGRSEPFESTDVYRDRILHATRARMPDGGYVAIYQDVTERKRSEEALAKSEERFRAIVDQLPNAVVVKDPQGRYELVNAAYCDWYGIADRDAAIGKTAAAFLPPAAHAIVTELEREVTRHHRVVQSELLTRFAGGDSHDLISSQFPLLAPDGEMFGMGAVLTDITEQKQAQARLARALSLVHESVDYAGRIQRALLPGADRLEQLLGEHFLIWEPKDGVGGDLLWARGDRDGCTICLFDCTGHGVPGALMTTIAISALDAAYGKIRNDPAGLIAEVNRRIKNALGQTGDQTGDSDDGLEMGICLLRPEQRKVHYAGARFPLVVLQEGEVSMLPGGRAGVGYRRTPKRQRFTNHVFSYGPATSIYLFTDGVTDQIGGPKRRAFGRKRLLDTLTRNGSRSMAEQRQALLAALTDYQGAEERRDDVSMLGIRLST